MLLDFGKGLIILAVAQLLFLSVFLFKQRAGNRLSNKLLATFFLLMAINFLDLLFKVLAWDQYYQRLALVDDGFILAFGPLILHYTQSVIQNHSVWQKKWNRHYLPFLVITLLLLVLSLINSEQHQSQMLQDIENAQLPTVVSLTVAMVQLHPIIYLFLAFIALANYRQHIKTQYSNLHGRDPEWLKFILSSVLILMLVALIHGWAPVFAQTKLVHITVMLLVIAVLFFVNRWIWKALKTAGLWAPVAVPDKYRGSRLSEQQRQQTQHRLERLLVDGQHYLNPDLTIDQLADLLEVNSKTLSQVINQSYEMNFYEFINKHRIETAQKLLLEDPKASVLTILYQCGYNSKSSFNTFFKKYTGTTPTAYRKRQKMRSSS